MNIEIRNLDGVHAALEKLDKTVNIEQAMAKACALVERSAKELAPKGDTGQLRRSITSKVERKDGKIRGIVFTPLEYAPYVEFGTGIHAKKGGRKDVPWCYYDERKKKFFYTSGQHPQPFMRPAYKKNRTRIIEIIKEGIQSD